MIRVEESPGIPLLIAATIDCVDLQRMTRFREQLLDVEFTVVEHFGFLAHSPDRQVTIWCGRFPKR